jgi:hypothetical protein
MWKKRSWPNFRHYPEICLEGLGKINENLSHDIQPPGLDLNLGLLEYEAGVLTTRPWRSVEMHL